MTKILIFAVWYNNEDDFDLTHEFRLRMKRNNFILKIKIIHRKRWF